MDIDRFLKIEKNLQYISGMRPLFDKKALFSDMTSDYLIPPEPKPFETIRIRFRAAKNNVDRVFCVISGKRELMTRESTDDMFDFYELKYSLEDKRVSYYFEIQIGKILCYYDKRGVTKDIQDRYAFLIVPGFSTPDWAKGAVMYQIYVDRFYNGDLDNDVLTNEYSYIGDYTTKVQDWYKLPAQMGVREFYGGDLQGVLDKIDYLQELGIDVIYFNPLFVSPSNHKYDIQDYDYIDPHFGKIVDEKGELLADGIRENRNASAYINRVTNKANLEASNQLFQKVVKEAHRRGIKVILDGVFNHCGSFNKWMDKECIYENAEGYEKGAYVSDKSPYRKYFRFHAEDQWPYNPSYDGWWGHDTLPKLNYENSKELYDYILDVGKKWVSPPFNADGWRLDVAADLGHSQEFNHQFWKDFRTAVKEANPNAIILAEHYEDPKPWLMGDEWDTIMNYSAFMEPITWFLTGMQKHSDDFREDLYGNAVVFWNSMRYHMASFTTPSLYVSMNELSNHDHSRFLTRTNKKVGRINTLGSEAASEGINKAVLREAVVFQMTWPGAPTIYYGDEAGLCGFTDPDNRRSYPWGREDHELIDFHKEMIRIHKENPEFLKGSIKQLEAEYNIIGYGRFTSQEQSIVLINNNDHEVKKEINAWEIGIPREAIIKRTLLTSADGYFTDEVEYLVVAGKFTITLPRTSAVILKHKNKQIKKFLQFK